MPRTKSILLVDADQQEGRALFSALVRAGNSVADTHRADYALDLLEDRSFEAAIVDVLSPRTEIDLLIRKLSEDWSNPLIVGLADFAAMVDQKPTLPRGPHTFMSKPVDVQKLIQAVSAEDPESFGPPGTDILDYLRCIADSGRDVSLELRDVHGKTCRLFVARGSLIHAVCGEHEGEAALFESLAFEGGYFSHLSWSDPERESVHQPLSMVLSHADEMLKARRTGVTGM